MQLLHAGTESGTMPGLGWKVQPKNANANEAFALAQLHSALYACTTQRSGNKLDNRFFPKLHFYSLLG
jgi:hypothetical protein